MTNYDLLLLQLLSSYPSYPSGITSLFPYFPHTSPSLSPPSPSTSPFPSPPPPPSPPSLAPSTTKSQVTIEREKKTKTSTSPEVQTLSPFSFQESPGYFGRFPPEIGALTPFGPVGEEYREKAEKLLDEIFKTLQQPPEMSKKDLWKVLLISSAPLLTFSILAPISAAFGKTKMAEAFATGAEAAGQALTGLPQYYLYGRKFAEEQRQQRLANLWNVLAGLGELTKLYVPPIQTPLEKLKEEEVKARTEATKARARQLATGGKPESLERIRERLLGRAQEFIRSMPILYSAISIQEEKQPLGLPIADVIRDIFYYTTLRGTGRLSEKEIEKGLRESYEKLRTLLKQLGMNPRDIDETIRQIMLYAEGLSLPESSFPSPSTFPSQVTTPAPSSEEKPKKKKSLFEW